MNVLADVQEEYGGDLLAVLNGSTLKSSLSFLAAMLNDYADDMGWERRYTAKTVGRELKKLDMSIISEVMHLVSTAVNQDNQENERKN